MMKRTNEKIFHDISVIAILIHSPLGFKTGRDSFPSSGSSTD
jgi:hypothetical protein